MQEYLLSGTKELSGNEIIFDEAAKNHVKNASIAKSILDKLSGGKSSFYWFIQPNGELNKSNPFLLEGHYKSSRYFINEYYQNHLLKNSAGFAVNLTNYGQYCKYCYVDEAHYSPAFSKKMASEIIKSIH